MDINLGGPEMPQKTRFSILLKHYRQIAGLSQEALAERAGLSARAISDLERGINRTPRYETLESLVSNLALSAQQRTLLQTAARSELTDLTDTPSEFPQVSFPLPPTRLLGREQERLRALALLRTSNTRLLTLTGPGGVGKTHLALELIHNMAPDFTDGVLYISLAAIRNPDLVPGELAQAFGLREVTSLSAAEQVAAYLGPKHFLLVLDNLEQVIECAPFIAKLLESCPRLNFLVTSRTPLRLRGEQELRLAPLLLADAVALFCERVQVLLPGQDWDLKEVAAICEKLDCLPLAIELIAIHTRLLSLPQLREKLNRRLALLSGGTRDLPPRQQTMEEAIKWSYELLTPEQQRCFRALSVFTGDWTLEAALAVCSANQELEAEPEIILRLAGLVDASLIQVHSAENDIKRFRMLEIVKEFALDRLREAGEEEHYRRQHAAYYARLAEKIILFLGPEQVARSPQFLGLVYDLPDGRAALEWAEESQEAELGLRLSGFTRLWHIRGQLSEAAHWMERMLALDEGARKQGKPVAPLTLRIERLYGVGRTLVRSGQIDKLEKAQAYAQRALQLALEIGDQIGSSNAWSTLGMIAQAMGQLEIAEKAFRESYKQASRLNHPGLIGRVLFHLGDLAQRRGQLSQARSLLEEDLAIVRSAEMPWDVAIVTTMLGRVAARQQLFGPADTYYREALSLFRVFGSPSYTAGCLEGFAANLCTQGHYNKAVRLWAAASEMRNRTQVPLSQTEREDFEQLIAGAKIALSKPVFDQEWQAGSLLNHDEAIEAALAESGLK
jgi:predicted ATPase/DNA-binding XRE family transcriptional regulator